MRFSALSALAVLGASIAASGSPIRVVVTEVSAVRYGHAAADSTGHFAPVGSLFAASAFAQPAVVPPEAALERSHHAHGNGRHFCKSMRAKVLDASNALRQWFGLEPIAADWRTQVLTHPVPMHHTGPYKVDMKGGIKGDEITILPFIGTPATKPVLKVDENKIVDHSRPMWVHRQGHHHLRGSFLRRVHHALMVLGPWEGRAVAFVLGCGIGVLLRMVWVMILVTARAFRSSRNEEAEYQVVFDEAEMLVPPPQYTIIEGNEAVPVPVDEKSDKGDTA